MPRILPIPGAYRFPWGEKPKRDPTIWKTKDGKVMPIKDMGSEHIKRAVAMLRRGAFASQVDKWPVFQNLLAEAARRNLDVEGNWDA